MKLIAVDSWSWVCIILIYFFFFSFQEFIRKAEMLLGDKHFRSDLISRAQADVFAHHNVKQEEQAYIQLLNTLHYRPPSSLITMDAEKRKE